MSKSDFIELKYTRHNLDKYFIRTSIFNALNKFMPKFEGKLLDSGCGKMPYKEYLLKHSNIQEYEGLDIESALEYEQGTKPDFTWNGITMPFENESYQTCIATEVLEHCPEPKIFLNEVHRTLKKDGVLFFTVPFLWNLHETPHDEYRYTPFSLERILKECKFNKIEIWATGGWHASMATMLGLWVRRSPINHRIKQILSIVFKPIIMFLLKKDMGFHQNFKDGQMITGLVGIAIK